MSDVYEKYFINFAESHEDSLKELGLTKESFIQQAKEWSQTREGKLEIQKFILSQEIKSLEEDIISIREKISRKEESIREIDDELKNL